MIHEIRGWLLEAVLTAIGGNQSILLEARGHADPNAFVFGFPV